MVCSVLLTPDTDVVECVSLRRTMIPLLAEDSVGMVMVRVSVIVIVR